MSSSDDIEKEKERARQRDLRQARSDKSSYENSKDSKQEVYNRNKEKIARLKIVKSNLEERKAEAKSKSSNLSNYSGDFCSSTEWVGDKHTKVVGVLNDTIIVEYDKYVERIDEVLDEVCNKITELENENYQLHGDILHLISAINSLINKIQTLCN